MMTFSLREKSGKLGHLPLSVNSKRIERITPHEENQHVVLERLKNQHVVPKCLLPSCNYDIVTIDMMLPGRCQDTMRWESTKVFYHLLGITFLEVLTEAKLLNLPTPLYNNDLPQETFRALIGWASEQWSVQARSSLISATPDQHLQAVLTCVEGVHNVTSLRLRWPSVVEGQESSVTSP